MSQPAFLRLPLHLVGMVLSQLDEMQTLGAAILSHPLLYAAYKDTSADRDSVIKTIIRNQIPPNVMRYAIMAYEAKRVDRTDQKALDRLTGWTQAERPRHEARFQEWYLEHGLGRVDGAAPASIAAALSKTHCDVQYFCSGFLQDVLPLAQKVRSSGTNARPNTSASTTRAASKTEIYRVQKALYRFQVYCDLRVRDENDLGVSQAFWTAENHSTRNVLSAFSPWVNEQLACVHDYLERVLSTAFDEVAAHDVEWGSQSIDWMPNGENNRLKQGYLTYGLHFLARLDRATDFEQRQQLLKSKGLPTTANGLAHHLSSACIRPDLCHCCPPGEFALSNQDQWTTNDFEMWLAGGSSDGIDAVSSDPFCIWWYAHKHKYCHQLVYQNENARLRRYGYVMWDLHPNRSFSKSRVREAQRELSADGAALEVGRAVMGRWWRERIAIFRAGGRGYWSPDDESRVVWPDGSNQEDQGRRVTGTDDEDSVEGKPGPSELGHDAISLSLPIRNRGEMTERNPAV